jgi:hypothetical protein
VKEKDKRKTKPKERLPTLKKKSNQVQGNE